MFTLPLSPLEAKYTTPSFWNANRSRLHSKIRCLPSSLRLHLGHRLPRPYSSPHQRPRTSSRNYSSPLPLEQSLRLAPSHAPTRYPVPPGRSDGNLFVRTIPSSLAFPESEADRPLHCRFRGLLSVHSCYGLHAHRVAYATFYTEGFSSFVASAAASIATGWNERKPQCRVRKEKATRVCLRYVRCGRDWEKSECLRSRGRG
jgi:hypothetical protein